MHIEIVCRPTTLGEAKEAEDLIALLRARIQGSGGHMGQAIREHILTGAEGHPFYDHGLTLRAQGSLDRDGADIPLLKAAE